MPALRKLYRMILLALLVIIGIFLTIIFLRNTVPANGLRSTIITTWLGLIARIFGARIKTYGIAQTEKTLFVANHISWLDIMVLGGLVPVHFLSKLEVKHMPVIGWLATRAGTLYIHRGNKESASEASSDITTVLKQGHNSLIFAEGTTSDGHIKRFHSRLMQSAIDAHAIVQPVAIFFPKINPETGKTELDPATLFVGDTSIAESFDLVTRAPHIDVEVHFLKPIRSKGKTRNEISQHAYDEVVDAIIAIKRRDRK
ncbi:MAG: 1-acyl-sn-glycerol-3-phosphate acyltransferase [Gammaproteobacteria bacterium]|nr:1-acyl-sn-glycerol-3-phosphate acyltransferase [Gammaproteobacteria bacterium]NNJ51290.1 1-acyl-sn-glycerol-3-phosphate acyltransferase [Gammaproteobacteria bacterium]